MWSKKPTPVATSWRPVPSRFSASSILVSAVSRRMVAVRGIRGVGPSGPPLNGQDLGQFFQQGISLEFGSHRDAQAVPVLGIAHVSYQDSSRLQSLINGL